MKAVRAESTRRALARPAARAVDIPRSGKRASARKAAVAVGIDVPIVNLAAPAEGIVNRTTSTRKNSALRPSSGGAPASASTCASSANSTRSGSSKTRCSAKSGSADTASSTAMGSQWRNGMHCSRGSVEIATSATRRYLPFHTSTMTTRAVLGSDPAVSVYADSPARNATRGSASSEIARNVCAGWLTTSKSQTEGFASGRPHPRPD